jgi:hypothetical protein
MSSVFVLVNHTKKCLIVVDHDQIWQKMKSRYDVWKDDYVEVMDEHEDFQTLKFLVNMEGYSHNLGNAFA